MQLEDYLFQNKELLGDIVLLKRQIRSGTHEGIPDLLDVDQDGKICLIELKNEIITDSVLLQVLRYAVWAETHPDSIKMLWLENDNRPDDVEINWGSLEIRLIVVGPDVAPNVLRMTNKYALELFGVKQFIHKKEEFILVERLESPESTRVRMTRAQEHYDAQFYEKEHGKEATTDFMSACAEVEALAKRKRWAVQKKLNKYYAGFKYGNTNPFSIHWSGHSWNVQIKVPEQRARQFKVRNWEMQRYDATWKQAVFKRASRHAKLSELLDLLVTAYETARGDD